MTPGDMAGDMARPGDSSGAAPDRAGSATLFLCGDVMTGRGIDQILPHPGDPRLCEPFVRSAAGYVERAEAASGPIPRPVDAAYIWGDALDELRRSRPDLRIVNLETSVTRSDDCQPKGINYRMDPDNIACLTAAGIDCCVLANNHVLDWGRGGLLETLDALAAARVRSVGAGRTDAQAQAPAALEMPGKGRLLLFAFGMPSAGVPRDWAAGRDRPGVNLLADLSGSSADRIAAAAAAARRPGDLTAVSLHWGGNWGYRITREERRFAHRLIDAGVDLVHGHSSHHVKGIEVHRGKPILYGCGDFLNDYEGIGGYEAYRSDLTLMYFPTIALAGGELLQLRLVPLQIRRFRLRRAARADAEWLRDLLNREGAALGTRAELRPDGSMLLGWA